ncbi:MAG TPA: hypothetical protein VNA17_09295 [Pyrinomonadaceae bacterium]|nr:hypothetical protein [Pyrinomonadaceae bacterium]
MKICTRCQTTYADDNLNFCLADGAVLSPAPAVAERTVLMGEPRNTNQPPMPVTPATQPAWAPQPQPYSMQQPKKSSKTWILVLLILGGLALLCGGGFIGFLFYVGSQVETAGNSANSGNKGGNLPVNRGTNNSNSNPGTTSTRTDLEIIDLSAWVRDSSAFGLTEMSGDDFIMASKQKGFYYVLVSPDGYTTENADTRVTLRNVNNAAGNLGYGLIFHSNPQPLQQDYAFLIDTKRQKYRVVYHQPKTEKSVVTWTTSTAIKEGAAENVLETRDMAGKIDLYINGTKVTTIDDVHGYAGGVPGLYAGDGVKVAFKNLEIRK